MTELLKFPPAGPLFIGAFIDALCAEKIEKKVREILRKEQYRDKISITGAPNLHCTLIFLGYASRLPLLEIKAWWERQEIRSFAHPALFKGAASFGRRSTTVHLKGIFHEQDHALQNRLEKSIKQLPLNLEEMSFKVHLTLGRFRGIAKDGRASIRKEIERLLLDGFGEEEFLSTPPVIRLAAKNPVSRKYEDVF
jgi:2'-5' RNA ligase